MKRIVISGVTFFYRKGYVCSEYGQEFDSLDEVREIFKEEQK